MNNKSINLLLVVLGIAFTSCGRSEPYEPETHEKQEHRYFCD